MLRLSFLVAVLIGSTPSFAQSATSCGDAPNQSEADVCVSEKFAKADAVLNRTYADLHGKLDTSGQRNLVAAERAWIAFRDQECNLRTGYDTEHPDNNGTIAPMLIGECRLALTRQRIRDLQAQVKCPGGDLSCTP